MPENTEHLMCQRAVLGLEMSLLMESWNCLGWKSPPSSLSPTIPSTAKATMSPSATSTWILNPSRDRDSTGQLCQGWTNLSREEFSQISILSLPWCNSSASVPAPRSQIPLAVPSCQGLCRATRSLPNPPFLQAEPLPSSQPLPGHTPAPQWHLNHWGPQNLIRDWRTIPALLLLPLQPRCHWLSWLGGTQGDLLHDLPWQIYANQVKWSKSFRSEMIPASPCSNV